MPQQVLDHVAMYPPPPSSVFHPKREGRWWLNRAAEFPATYDAEAQALAHFDHCWHEASTMPWYTVGGPTPPPWARVFMGYSEPSGPFAEAIRLWTEAEWCRVDKNEDKRAAEEKAKKEELQPTRLAQSIHSFRDNRAKSARQAPATATKEE